MFKNLGSKVKPEIKLHEQKICQRTTASAWSECTDGSAREAGRRNGLQALGQ